MPGNLSTVLTFTSLTHHITNDSQMDLHGPIQQPRDARAMLNHNTDQTKLCAFVATSSRLRSQLCQRKLWNGTESTCAHGTTTASTKRSTFQNLPLIDAFGIGTLLTCSVSSAPPEGGQRQQHVSCGCDVALTLKRMIGGFKMHSIKWTPVVQEPMSAQSEQTTISTQ